MVIIFFISRRHFPSIQDIANSLLEPAISYVCLHFDCIIHRSFFGAMLSDCGGAGFLPVPQGKRGFCRIARW